MDALPPRVRDLVFVLSAHNSRDLTKFSNITMTVSDTEMDAEFTRFDVGQGGRSESVAICSLSCLSDGLWHALGIGTTCRGTAKDHKLVLDKLLTLGYPRNVSMRRQEPIILQSMQQTLDFQRPVKGTALTISATNVMKLHYVLELVESEIEPGDAPDLTHKVTKQAVITDMVTAMAGSGADRFRPRHIVMLPAEARAMAKLSIEVRWRYPHPDDLAAEERDCRFVDVAGLCFSRRALQEVVDYRGAHGVRLVHNGVFDESGVWLGKVGTGDATDGQISYQGEKYNDLAENGEQSLVLNLEKMPPSSTDVFLVATSPVVQDIGIFQDVKVVLRDAENPGHEIMTINMPQTATPAEAAILCRISRTEGRNWQVGAFRSGCNGNAIDYRPLIAHLRNIQERKHGRTAPLWSHRVSRLDAVKQLETVMNPLLNWKKNALSRRHSAATASLTVAAAATPADGSAPFRASFGKLGSDKGAGDASSSAGPLLKRTESSIGGPMSSAPSSMLKRRNSASGLIG
mmetsp:Transcript_159792/g.512763  ORF Transcript_159792/g.512763 Transcript_159792/m.512763 type:complete len:516 (+) Transcript_159792:295-1842(+)